MEHSWLKKLYLQLTSTEEDRTDDVGRLETALAAAGIEAEIPFSLVRRRYDLLRQPAVTVTLARVGEKWRAVRLEPGDTSMRCFALAADLGSTTVVMRLMDFSSGSILAEDTVRNGQRAYGDDILSRIFYTKDSEERRQELQAVTAGTINDLAAQVCAEGGVPLEDCCALVVAGNTTMIHFLLGLDTFCIFQTPFRPVLKAPGILDGAELGLQVDGPVYCFPATANYLGGDIISGILSTGMTEREETALFLDIGTNGEMVIGNREFLIGGAGAAGPALEGGISRSGMRAREGAVDSIRIEDNELTCTVIGGVKPLGICGSGIVDLLAQMLLAGWMDRQGTLQPEKTPRIRQVDGEWAVAYADETESGSGEALLFTQTDIRQFTETKAAAHTMVAVLLNTAGMTLEDVDRIYLAGAFGRHIDLESGITIGIYPDAPREKFQNVGNSSLTGACDLLSGKVTPEEADRVAKEIYYVEFAMQETFVEEMRAASFYPHTNLEQYPTVAAKLPGAQKQ